MSFAGEPGSDETSALVELPEIPEENVEAWERIEATQIQPRMKRALRRLASGSSLRVAAESEGYGSKADLFRYAQKHGLISMTDRALVNQFRRTAYKSLDMIEDRITDDPDSVSTRDLTIIAGVATDKIAKKERWGQPEPDDSLGNCLLEIAEKIIPSPGRLGIHITAEPGEPSDPIESARDVTPRPGTGSLTGDPFGSRP